MNFRGSSQQDRLQQHVMKAVSEIGNYNHVVSHFAAYLLHIYIGSRQLLNNIKVEQHVKLFQKSISHSNLQLDTQEPNEGWQESSGGLFATWK